MRTSKFRVLHLADDCGPAKWHYIELPEQIKGNELWMSEHAFDWNTWSEWTGFTDKRGEDIYEGDRLRVEFPEYTGKEADAGWVVWDGSEGSWRIQSYSWWSYIISSDVEVFSNIYEKPGLLKPTKIDDRQG